MLRQKMNINENQAIFLFVGNTIPELSAIMDNIHHKYKDSDGFLYMSYTGEETYGRL
ncbi:hypothetical protein MXB_1332 [Myxobolus squamalis]|nr:hypothetical protein MXB_1332 [Myxobolus squamalis]